MKSLSSAQLLALGAVVCALNATGCVAASRYSCPDTGDRVAWHHVRSNHIDLRTDMEAERAEQVVRELERAWAAQDRVSGGAMRKLDRVRLVMLRDSGEMERFTAERWRFITGSGPASASVLPDPAEGNALGRGDHPAVGVMGQERAAKAYPQAPSWLLGGIGSFLGTMAPQPGSPKVHIGMPDPDYLRLLSIRPPMTLAQLWASEGETEHLTGEKDREELFYRQASAWLWVHYLALMQDQRFSALQRLLAYGADARAAWAHVFKGIPEQQLNTEVMQHAAAGGRRYFVYEQAPLQVDVQVERMSPADAHALHARLRLWQVRVKPEAEKEVLAALDGELAEAQKRDPKNPTALLVRMERAGEASADAVAALQQALVDSDDEDGWRQLPGLLQKTKADARSVAQAHLDATRHLPRDAQAHYEAASFLLGEKRAAEAAPLATRAVELAPSNVYYLDTQAVALAVVGRCADAVAAASRMVELAPRGTEAHDQAQSRLAELKACKK